MRTAIPLRTEQPPTEERDPVCGMTVRPDTPHQTTIDGKTYRFCCAGCVAKFSADPYRYLKPESRAAQPAPPPANEYTCPMHPQIVRDAPGNCPICGMALEPRTVSLGDEENPELVDMSR